MKKQFHVHGAVTSIVNFDEKSLHDNLPAKVYTIIFNPMAGFALKEFGTSMPVPEEVFGDTEAKAELMMESYKERNHLSMMLTGAKGSGKSLLSAVIANKMIENGVPVIIVDEHFDIPDALKDFLYELGNCFFIFDEFAKNFSEEIQPKMLDFFSGTRAADRGVIIIENHIRQINEFMMDRPGRIRYRFGYGKLPLEVIKQVCDARDVNEQVTKYILEYSSRATTIGMDTVNRIIEETKFQEARITDKTSFKRVIEMMNIPQDYSFEYELVEVQYNKESFTDSCFPSMNIQVHSVGSNFLGMEHHPLVKAMLADNNKWLQQQIKAQTYDIDVEGSDETKTVTDWDDIYFNCVKPVFSNGGDKVFTHKESGLSFVVRIKESEDDLIFSDYF